MAVKNLLRQHVNRARKRTGIRRKLFVESLEDRRMLAGVPTIHLDPSCDTGRSNSDNITSSLDDGCLETNDAPAVFATSLVQTGAETLEDGSPVLTFSEGRHAYTRQVLLRQIQPVSGPVILGSSNPVFIETVHSSTALIVTIDETPPDPATISLDVVSDTGIAGDPSTLVDGVTNDPTSAFTGITESNAAVRLFADGNFSGLSVAQPGGGSDDFTTALWRQTTALNLNDPTSFTLDGLRQMSATAEDVAGNVSEAGTVNVFLDTQGPQVQSVFLTIAPEYDLFNPKPSIDGPTPAAAGISISVIDFPPRSNAESEFLYPALHSATAENPGHYVLRGDHTGIIPIDTVTFVADPAVDGQPATGTIHLGFTQSLPDDRLTLTLSDTLADNAGNALNGENNAAEPQETPNFPTGDTSAGGIFTARLTVDTRAEIGVWAAGSVWVDTNGNFVFDSENKDNDNTNEDIAYVLGFTTDNIFAGNFAGNQGQPLPADGFDKLAAYGLVGGSFRWLIDTDNNGVPNLVVSETAAVNGLPIAGNFDGSGGDGDEVGLKNGTTWHLDTNHDYLVDTTLQGNMNGYPIVGDFDGDGTDDLGAWTDDTFSLDLSTVLTGDAAAGTYHANINGTTDVQFAFGFPGPRERPVAADFDGDGHDDLGLWTPDRSGAVPAEGSEWYLLISGGNPIIDRIIPNRQGDGMIIDFIPQPFGNDLFAQYGDEFGQPVVGNFDPPVVASPVAQPRQFLSFTNPVDAFDVNGDGYLSPVDVLHVINFINSFGSEDLPAIRVDSPGAGPFLDPTNDYVIAPIDVLVLINALNASVSAEAEGNDRSFSNVQETAPHRTGRADRFDPSLLVSGSRYVHPSQLVSDPAVAASTGDKQGNDHVDAFFAQALDYSPRRVGLRAARNSEKLDELLDELAGDPGQPWWNDSSANWPGA